MTETKLSKTKAKKEVLSRPGRKPVDLPDGVKASVNERVVTVEGKKGKLNFRLPPLVSAKVEGKQVSVNVTKKGSESKPFHGLSRKLIYNMVLGVSNGFQKKLVIEGVGFRAQVSGDKLTMSLGFSHPAVYRIPKEVKVSVSGKGQNELLIEGIDKQLVGQVAAEIRSIREPEPYKGTGIRYDFETIRRKAGKAAVGAGGGKK